MLTECTDTTAETNEEGDTPDDDHQDGWVCAPTSNAVPVILKKTGVQADAKNGTACQLKSGEKDNKRRL